MPRFRKGKRNKARSRMVVPVRVRLPGTRESVKAEAAYTLDATESGVRVAGLLWDLEIGDIIELQYRHERGFFRVVWLKTVGKSSEKQIGAECVEPDKNIWGVDFPEIVDEYEDAE